MSDNKLTDNEIIKALEYCSKGVMFSKHDCNKCPYYGEMFCEQKCKENALDLLKRKDEQIEALIAGQETLRKYIAEAKSEAVKEFAERSGREISKIPQYHFSFLVVKATIEKVKKEMVGEK